jgi:hypothetical protein
MYILLHDSHVNTHTYIVSTHAHLYVSKTLFHYDGVVYMVGLGCCMCLGDGVCRYRKVNCNQVRMVRVVVFRTCGRVCVCVCVRWEWGAQLRKEPRDKGSRVSGHSRRSSSTRAGPASAGPTLLTISPAHVLMPR